MKNYPVFLVLLLFLLPAPATAQLKNAFKNKSNTQLEAFLIKASHNRPVIEKDAVANALLSVFFRDMMADLKSAAPYIVLQDSVRIAVVDSIDPDQKKTTGLALKDNTYKGPRDISSFGKILTDRKIDASINADTSSLKPLLLDKKNLGIINDFLMDFKFVKKEDFLAQKKRSTFLQHFIDLSDSELAIADPIGTENFLIAKIVTFKYLIRYMVLDRESKWAYIQYKAKNAIYEVRYQLTNKGWVKTQKKMLMQS